jgi:hypothetical protein
VSLTVGRSLGASAVTLTARAHGVQVVTALVRAKLEGKASLGQLLEGYTEAAEGREIRLGLPRDCFTTEGAKV